MVKRKRLRRKEEWVGHGNRRRWTSERKITYELKWEKTSKRKKERKKRKERKRERKRKRKKSGWKRKRKRALYSPRLLADCKRARLTWISALCSIKHAKQKAIVKHRFKLSCESVQMLPSLSPFSGPYPLNSPYPYFPWFCRLYYGNFSCKRIARPNMGVISLSLYTYILQNRYCMRIDQLDRRLHTILF